MVWDKVIIEKARKLRLKGKTYSEINSRMSTNISKSTFNSWFKGLLLPTAYYKKIDRLNRKAVRKARKVNEKKLKLRLLRLKQMNANLINRIDFDIAKLLLAMLYLCEGSKYPSTRNMRFGSSYPGMIRLFMCLLRNCFEIKKEKLRGELQCRADQNTQTLIRFWSKVSGIPLIRFYPSRIDKRTINKPTMKKDYRGVFVINYFDVDIQLELQFLGEYLGEVGPVAHLARALLWHSRGGGFKSHQVHQK